MSAASRLWALDPATLVVPGSALVAEGADDRPVRIPIPVFLIEHPRGLVLFDTGLHPDAVLDPARTYGERAERLGLQFTAAQRTDRQVRATGHRPDEVGYVVLSHLHFDHAGGAALFPAARIVLGAGEIEHARGSDDRYVRADDVDAVARTRPREIESDVDLFGDGSVVVVRTPGHTPGHVSLLVRLQHAAWLLTGDATHARTALDRLLPFPGDHDPDVAVASLRRLAEIADETGARIWIGHDPADWRRWSAVLSD